MNSRSIRRIILLLGFVATILQAFSSLSQSHSPTQMQPSPSGRDIPSCTLELKLQGAVAPGMLDYLSRGFQKAQELSCNSILLLINSPGGNLHTTRLIVEKILASPIPILCLVSPSGGHAGSAGAIILLSCHVAGAEPATNIGAATPISGTGTAMPDDVRNKLVQDTQSWVRGLARHRGRNMELAEKIVTEARAVDVDDAVKSGVIDLLSVDVQRFLDAAEGRTVAMAADRTETVRTGALTVFEPDLRHDFLQIITDPEFAYLLFMASLALLYFEFTHPGVIAPGIAGTLGLVASLMAFHKLEVWWGAVSMIVIGIGLLVAEAIVPSFGALGIGGIIALGAGSFLLYDPGTLGHGLSPALIIATTGTLGVLMLGLALIAFKTRQRGKAKGEVALLGQIGEVMSLEAPSLRRGMAQVKGEMWRFVSEKDVRPGENIEVLAQEGLTLKVKPQKPPSSN